MTVTVVVVIVFQETCLAGYLISDQREGRKEGGTESRREGWREKRREEIGMDGRPALFRPSCPCTFL